MFSIYSNIEYNVQGDTYFAYDDEKNAYYRVYGEHDRSRWVYVLEFYEDLGMPAAQTRQIGKQIVVDSQDDAVLSIDILIGKLAGLATSGKHGAEDLLGAWNSLEG